MKNVVIAGVVVLAVAATAHAFAGPHTWGPHAMAWHGGFSPFAGLTTLLFWGAVVAFAVMAIRGRNHRWAMPHHSRNGDAFTILRERFAKGEISAEEYQERKRVLTDEPPR